MNTTELHIPSNKVGDIERYCHQELDTMYGFGEVNMMVRLLFEAFLGWNLTDLLLRRDNRVDQSDLLRFHWAVEDLKKWRPIQHIIGHTSFCGCKISVDENVLIPRPETEEMVQKAIEVMKNHTVGRVIDLCCGSGCIAIALAKTFIEAKVTAVDISEHALDVARHNAVQNGVAIEFRQCDLLAEDLERSLPFEQYDMIVSNPPYVMENEKSAMMPNVLDYEPHTALFVPDSNPLVFYQCIAEFAKRRLAKGGLLMMEINEKLGDETLDLLNSYCFYGIVENDFRGKARWVRAEN